MPRESTTWRFDMDEFLSTILLIFALVVLFGWLSCPFVASGIARSYQKPGWGFTYGLAFGPIGIIIALLYRLNVSADETFEVGSRGGELDRDALV
jgi:hypothetical protein